MIAQGTYPHVRNAETKHDDLTEILPERIRAAFRKTFVEGFQDPSKRLTPKDWIVLLKRELKALKQCQACPEQYEGSAPYCPYCAAERVNLMARCGNVIAAQARRLCSLPVKALRALVKRMVGKAKPSAPPKMRLPKGRSRFAEWYPIVLVVVFIGLSVEENIRNNPYRSKNTEDSAQQVAHATLLNAAAVATPRQHNVPEKKSEQAFMELVAQINRAAIVPTDQATIRQSADGIRRYEYVSRDYTQRNGAVKEFSEIKARIERFVRGSGTFREVPMPELHQHFSEGCLFRSVTHSMLLIIERFSGKHRVVFIAT